MYWAVGREQGKGRHTWTCIETDRQTDRHAQRLTEKTDSDMLTHRGWEGRQTNIHRGKETDRQTENQWTHTFFFLSHYSVLLLAPGKEMWE